MKQLFAVITCTVLLMTAALTEGITSEGQLKQAQQLEKVGHLEEALRIYRELLVERPGDKELLALVQRVYKEMKLYPQLIELLRERLDKAPGDFQSRIDLGEAYFLSGELQTARDVWLEALRLAPRQADSYLRVATVFLERGMLAEAEEILMQGRRVLQDGSLFADLLARICELRADYGTAAREYMIWLVQDLRRLSFVDAQLARFPDQSGVHQAVEEALREAVSASPGQEVFRHLLSQHLIRRGKPEEAYREILAIEDGQGSGGQILLRFASRCAELGYHQVAIQACQDLQVRYPEATEARQGQLVIGESMIALGRYDEALGVYGRLLAQHPQSAEAVEALYARGEIAFLHGGAVDSALVAYRKLVENFARSSRAADAIFRIGDCLAVQGDMDGARGEYSRLLTGNYPEDVREKTAFKLAELLFLDGHLQESKEAFDKLVSDYPQGFYVNDALVLTVLLDEGLAGEEEVLKIYAQAMRLVRQRDYGTALAALEELEEGYSDSQLMDDVLLQTALIREQTGRYEEALNDLRTLISGHPQSRLCPQALRTIGEIYELRLGDLASARQVYERLLEEYPDYLFLDEVRRTLRRLKQQGTS